MAESVIDVLIGLEAVTIVVILTITLDEELTKGYQ